MKSLDKIFKLADKFTIKLAQDISQAMEAPDFFFGKGYNMKSFVDSLGRLSIQGDKAVGDKSLAQLMANFFNKTGQNVSVTITVSVTPGKGATWNAQVTPASFKAIADGELNKQFQAVTGKGLAQGIADANTAAKAAKSVEGPATVQVFDAGL